MKKFPIREGHTMEFRAESFNFPNHVNFTNGWNWTITSKTLGSTTGATADRQIQFALHYQF